jgi:hypothetical protein
MAAWKSTPKPDLTIQAVGTNSSSVNAALSSGEGFSFGANDSYTGWDANSTQGIYSGSESYFNVPNLGVGCFGAGNLGIWTGLGGINSRGYSSDPTDHYILGRATVPHRYLLRSADSKWAQANIPFNSTQLIQSGIEGGINLGSPTVWQPFWEILNSSNPTIPPFILKTSNTAISISPGDKMFSSTWYYAPSGTINFYILDLTTGQSGQFSFTNTYWGSTSSFYDGSTAEVIAESAGGYDLNFQDFSTSGNDAQAPLGTWSPMTDFGNERFYVPGYTSVSGNGNAFNVNFVGCP